MASSSSDGKEPCSAEASADPEDREMEDETEQVVRGFVYTRLSSRVEQEGQEGNLSVACIPRNVLRDLRGSAPHEDSSAAKLGSTLAALGDEIQLKYKDTFQDMITQLELTPDTAYSSFASVTRRLFNNGISWGRIVALLCFGYEIAISVIQQGARGAVGFLRRIIRYVVNFIVSEKIGQWIAAHGGWAAVIDFRQNGTDVWLKRAALSFSIVLACVVVMHSWKKGPE